MKNRLFMCVRLVIEIMLFLTDRQVSPTVEGDVHSVMAPVVSDVVINHGAGEEDHLPAGRAGDEVGHSNTGAGKDGNLAAMEADGTLIASDKLADMQTRTWIPFHLNINQGG